MRRLAPIALFVAGACAGVPGWRYRAEGSFGDPAPPLYVDRIGAGDGEYRLEAASVVDPDATFVRIVRATGAAPLDVDLGRVRLLGAGGEEIPVDRICVLGETLTCLDPTAARGQVRSVAPGTELRFRVDFGPIDATPAGRGRSGGLGHVRLVEDGFSVGGRPAPLTVPLERIEPR